MSSNAFSIVRCDVKEVSASRIASKSIIRRKNSPRKDMGDLLAKNLPLRECDHSSLKEYATFHFAYYRLEWGPRNKNFIHR